MSVLENLNYIKNTYYYPCAKPDPVLVVEAGFRALGPAIWEAATFSCLDFVRLRAGISPWHSRGLRALVKNINPPEIQSEINGIYKFVIPLERILHYMWLADLGSDFIATWQSQIFKLDACNEGTFTCTFSGDNPGWASDGSGTYAYVSYGPTDGSPICPGIGGTEWIVQPDQFWSATFTLTPQPIFVGDTVGGLDMQIIEFLPGGRGFMPQNYVPAWFGNTVHGIYSRHSTNVTRHTQIFRFQAKSDKPATAASGTCQITLSNRPVHNAGILPVNCLGQVIQPPI